MEMKKVSALSLPSHHVKKGEHEVIITWLNLPRFFINTVKHIKSFHGLLMLILYFKIFHVCMSMEHFFGFENFL